jgi:hypothetical protein
MAKPRQRMAKYRSKEWLSWGTKWQNRSRLSKGIEFLRRDKKRLSRRRLSRGKEWLSVGKEWLSRGTEWLSRETSNNLLRQSSCRKKTTSSRQSDQPSQRAARWVQPPSAQLNWAGEQAVRDSVILREVARGHRRSLSYHTVHFWGPAMHTQGQRLHW